jgi:hypothetical protein
MIKNKQALYLSGLISEEQLTENSDFERGMASVQNMRGEFDKLVGHLSQCLNDCEALERQAEVGYDFHDKVGIGRVDSKAEYFENLLQEIMGLAKSLRVLFGQIKSQDSNYRLRENDQIEHIKKSFESLANRLRADVA